MESQHTNPQLLSEGSLPPEQESAKRKQAPIRFRAVAIGLALIPVAGMWIFGGEMGGRFQRYTFATWAAPFYNAIYILFILTLINMVFRKYLRRLALTSLELLAIYAMVSVGSAIISSDFQGILVTLMGHKAYFADGTNNWATKFAGHLPEWLMVNNKEALIPYYQGDSTFWKYEHYSAWIKPIICWTLFTWALLTMMLCVNTILRKAWIERERLTFPIVALPMAMTDEPERFFKNKLMWIGFAFAGGLTLMNCLNFWYPNIPSFPIKRVDYTVASSGPLMGLGSVRIAFYFFAISLGFLMPLDLSFSLYFFYMLFKFEGVACQLVGIPPESGFPYTTSQSFGAYIAIFCVAVWGLRRHLVEVWRIALGRGDPGADDAEPMRYRSAIIGFGLSALFLLAFAVAAGMSGLVALVFFAIWLAISVMITRIRAEFGFPVHDLSGMGPDQTMVRLVGYDSFDRTTLGAFSLFYWFNRIYRSHPMPHQMEAMKMAGADGRAQRSMFRTVMIAGLVAVPICFLVYLHGFYTWGAATAHVNGWGTGYGGEAFGRLTKYVDGLNTSMPAAPETGDKLATGFGFLFALALAMLRTRIVGFPFHPLAYAVANSWGMQNLWLPIMIGSWCKAGVQKSLGLQGYRKAMMLFFGLMLGEFAVGCSFTIYGLILGIPSYDFWP